MTEKLLASTCELTIPQIEDVLKVEQSVKAQISAMWANDSEFWDIDVIVSRARAGSLDAVTAILRIQSIMESKQAYH